ncbi:MAG: class I SAM-dependent methyltransferase [Phycisphaerae bacterium]
MDLKEQQLLGDDPLAHWYYRAKALAMDRYLRGVKFQTVIDVGAGSGVFSRYLVETGRASRAICVDPFYQHEHSEELPGGSIDFRRRYHGTPAGLMLLMDVLEHVDDDREMLSGYVRQAQPGAAFLITVPAFEFLWSAHDEYLRHKRRYTRRQLLSVVDASGLAVEQAGYFYASVFPIAAALRLVRRLTGRKAEPASQLRRHSPLVNGLLWGMCRAELPLLKVNRLFGLTVFCLARKPLR